ncbi:MAG: GNAT family N-acetyltransferase [Proteobacteria bacterium]|nr:GNAT family N-acetyltransferase [Pseudomonadota bacterium]
MFTDPKDIAAFEQAMQAVNGQLSTGLGSPCFQLRVATPSDIAECKAINKSIKQKDFLDLGDEVYERSLKGDSSAVLVAVSPDNKVIGALCVNFSKGYGWHIDLIVSSPDHRNEGPIGTALCCALMGALQRLDVNHVSLEAAVAMHSPKGNIFNQKLFDWYQQKFKFEVTDPIYYTLIRDALMDPKDAALNIGLIKMDQFDVKKLHLEPILQEAIQKKQSAKESKKTEDIFPPILQLIEEFKNSHKATPPTDSSKQKSRFSLLFSKSSKEHRGSSQPGAQMDAINKLEQIVLSAQKPPGNAEKLRSDIEEHMKKADPQISKLCQTILDEHLPSARVTRTATLKGH